MSTSPNTIAFSIEGFKSSLCKTFFSCFIQSGIQLEVEITLQKYFINTPRNTSECEPFPAIFTGNGLPATPTGSLMNVFLPWKLLIVSDLRLF